MVTHIAILGYGVVGSGIARVLQHNRSRVEKKAGRAIAVKRVLDVRDFPGDPVSSILTHNFEDILNDDEIKIVAEVIGGIEPAYTFVKQALLRGKHVCTSNKELVIKHGAELLEMARERELNFLFEASVGGGIPIIRPMNLALTTDEVAAVAGILNGTSNYILTHMGLYGKSFAEALSEAQALGYAEKDPSADVGGYDACRKLAILLSLATGSQVDFEQIHTEGIESLARADFAFARAFGYDIKLLADGRVTPGGVEALTAPMLVHNRHPLSNVAGVFNGVLVQAVMTDNIMFVGRGAGKLPTACAVVSDIVDITKHLNRHIIHIWSRERAAVAPVSGYIKKRMVRIEYTDKTGAMEAFRGRAEAPPCFLEEFPNQMAWISPPETESDSAESLKSLAQAPGVVKIHSCLRVYQPLELEADA